MGNITNGNENASSARGVGYQVTLESALDAIVVIDPSGCIRESNRMAERMLGRRCDEMRGSNIATLVPSWDTQIHPCLESARGPSADGISTRRLERVAIRADGGTFPVELTVSSAGNQTEPGSIVVIRDLSERHRLAAAIDHNATHDAVTGLDRYIILERRLIGMLKEPGVFIAVLVVDLDLFHGINESIGHVLGDEVLRSVGARLQSVCNDDAAVCHFASDEFVVIRRGGDRLSALRFAEGIRELLAGAFEADGYRVLLTATVGMSTAPAHGDAALDLLRRAQLATERGKALGRDCTCAFQTRDMQAIEDRVVMGGLLRSASLAGELMLHFQPKFSASDLALTGFEALLRWHSPVLGRVPPARFIPIAEALGLMPEIGTWVIREACRQARAWLDVGHRGFTIAVNVSPQQLRRPGLARAVADALRKYRLGGEMLEIELTESSVMEVLPRVQRELTKLRALGTTLTLDDFGTGFSSLTHLKQLTLDKLKIDQTFVRGLPECLLDGSIARAIVMIGHDLGLQVVAEGVETTAQAEFLDAMGCDELQGFLLGEPTPAVLAEVYFDGVDPRHPAIERRTPLPV